MLVLSLSLVALFVVMASIGFAIPVLRTMTVRLRARRTARWVDEGTLPQDVLASLRLRASELEIRGFRHVGALRDDDPVDGVEASLWSLVLRSADGRNWARVSIAEAPMRAQPVDVTLLSFGDDGADGLPVVVETTAWRSHRVPTDVPGHHVVDARSVDLDSQIETHFVQTAALEDVPLRTLSQDELLFELSGLRARVSAHERVHRRVAERPDGSLRHTLLGALRRVRRINRGESARRRALAAVAGAGAARDLTADLVAHRRREAVEASRERRTSLRRTMLFLGSMLLFLALFGLRFSMETVLLLVAALVLHEAGHALAMWCFGYRDLQIVFVPFLGALASGRKADARPWQEVIVLLAGPVPGIALGTWLMTSGAADRDPTVYAFMNILVLMNFVNLLPVQPLDGGKVMSILVFDRFPALQLAFNACSGLAIVGAGLLLGEIAIVFVGAALLMAVPFQSAQTRTLLRLRRAVGRAGLRVADPLRAIYQELQHPDFDGWTLESRYHLVSRLRERLGRELAGRHVVALSLAFYVAAWVVPVDALLEHHMARTAASPAAVARPSTRPVPAASRVHGVRPAPPPVLPTEPIALFEHEPAATRLQ